MKDFFKMLGASTLGFIIGGIILSIFSFIIFAGIMGSMSSKPTYRLEEGTVLNLRLDGVINDRVSETPFDFLMAGTANKAQKLEDILSSIKKAKENDKIKGIYIKAGMIYSGYATLEPIRRALIDFKESGKFIVAYGEIMTQGTYYLAATADKLFLNPQGMFEFSGLSWSTQFNKDVFKKWGVDIQVFKVGTYKSAVEPFIDTKMSDANREQVTSYLNDIWGRLLEGISESRNISIEQLNKYADQYLMFSDPKLLVEYGLIDELKYSSEVEAYIKEQLNLGKDDKLKLASVENIKTVANTSSSVKKGKDRIAVLYAEGEIVADQAASIYSSNVITAKEYVKELNKLKNDDNVKAVVFRVNSPGGSAYASEQIWHAVKELKEVKPVIVSMGTYAASGGYYISCAASKIVSEYTTLTGSIGIFGMYPSGEQLAQRMGAHFDGVGTNEHSLFGGSTLSIPFIGVGLLPARQLNEAEQNMFQTYVERGYDLFLTRCADGRGMTKEQIDAVGQGRVWTGHQALELGLVDELGGLTRAIEIASDEAGIDEYTVSHYPTEKDFFTQLLEESSTGISTRIAKSIIGEDVYESKKMLNVWQNFDYRQAIMLTNN